MPRSQVTSGKFSIDGQRCHESRPAVSARTKGWRGVSERYQNGCRLLGCRGRRIRSRWLSGIGYCRLMCSGASRVSQLYSGKKPRLLPDWSRQRPLEGKDGRQRQSAQLTNRVTFGRSGSIRGVIGQDQSAARRHDASCIRSRTRSFPLQGRRRSVGPRVSPFCRCLGNVSQ